MIPKTFKYKVPHYRMSQESKRNVRSNLRDDKSLDPSTMRYSWNKKQQSPLNHYGARDMLRTHNHTVALNKSTNRVVLSNDAGRATLRS